VDQVDAPIGDDTLETQERMGGEKLRDGGRDRILESERTAQSIKPARFSLHPQCGILGRFSLDDRRSRMFEDLLPDLGQGKSTCTSIKQSNAEPLLQQRDAPADP
jgi:hypothetical protein